MRRLLLVVALGVSAAACSHAKSTGLAWPEPSKTADDGGESIAPHEASTVAAAIEKSDDEPEAKAAVDTPAATPAASEDKPASAPAATPPPNDDVIMSDEIIIEIDD
jgi:hypothetical protein